MESLGPGQGRDAEKPAGLDQGARPIGGREALPEGVTGRRAGVTLINVEALDSHGHRCLGGQRGAFSGLDASLLETACVMGTFSPSLPLVP